MIVWTLRHLLYLRRMLLKELTAHHLALGCAAGLMLGLMPKGNLLAFGLTAAILAVRVHVPTAMLTTVVVSLIGTVFDPLTHPLGLTLLTNQSLQPLWRFLYRQPFAPWTSMNNTVVLGSLCLGLLAFVPVYLVARLAFDRLLARRVGKELAEDRFRHDHDADLPQAA